MATGWPPDSDLADRLGLDPADDTARVASANAAAAADAAYYGVDECGPADGAEYEAVLLMGQWWYENRNRPEGLDSLNPVASPYYRRIVESIIIARRGMGVA